MNFFKNVVVLLLVKVIGLFIYKNLNIMNVDFYKLFDSLTKDKQKEYIDECEADNVNSLMESHE